MEVLGTERRCIVALVVQQSDISYPRATAVIIRDRRSLQFVFDSSLLLVQIDLVCKSNELGFIIGG
eukprot:scaffold1512_cov192-Alexandrium_tamarense.AAC.44